MSDNTGDEIKKIETATEIENEEVEDDEIFEIISVTHDTLYPIWKNNDTTRMNVRRHTASG